MKKNIRRVFWLYLLLFVCVIGYMGKFIIMDSKEVTANSYNPRLKQQDKSIIRGSIYDTNGIVLAYSKEPGAAQRSYPYGKYFAHTVGYTALGLSGIESKYNFTMQKPANELLQRLQGIIVGKAVSGESLKLTLDAELQEMVYEMLGNQKGAVIVLEPSTGRILSMVSYPSFDPEQIGANWRSLESDIDNSPLVNRASQGLYPPGSVFKILTAAAAMEYLPEYEEFVYECRGEGEFNGEKIRCFNETAHGKIDMHKAMALSCNTYFAALGMEIGGGNLLNVCERAYFNSAYPFPLEYNRSSFSLNQNSQNFEIVQTSIGQGKTLVSPLHMAMITAAVANGGIMMQPYLVESETRANGIERNKVFPKSIGSIFTLDESQALKDMLVKTVNEGTAQPVKISGVQVAAKTGTAENASGDDHGWFIAFAPAENPQVALAIVLENSGGPKKAQPIAKSIIEHVLNQ